MVLRDEDPTAFRGLLEAAVAGDGDAERAYVRLLDLPIVVRPHVPFEDILARAATDELSVYDAAYLALAIRDRSSLATTDRRLAAAAAVHRLLFAPLT